MTIHISIPANATLRVQPTARDLAEYWRKLNEALGRDPPPHGGAPGALRPVPREDEIEAA